MNAKYVAALFSASLCLSLPAFSSASLVADAELSITDIRISSDVNASFMWLNSWMGMTQADTGDSISGSVSNDDDEMGNDFSLSSSATTPYSNATSSISLSAGESIGFGNGVFDLTLGSQMNLTESDMSSFAEIFGLFANAVFVFDIDGGSLANVDIEVDFEYTVNSALTDGATYDLLLGTQLFLNDLNDQPNDRDDVDDMALDIFDLFLDGEVNESGSGTLSISSLLEAEKEYQLFGVAGMDLFATSGTFTEPPVEVIAPPTALLGLLGWMLVGFRRRQ